MFQHILEGFYGELSTDPDFPGHGYLWESGGLWWVDVNIVGGSGG